MYKEIDKAIKTMAIKVAEDKYCSSDALKYSQAALNLAHVKTSLDIFLARAGKSWPDGDA